MPETSSGKRRPRGALLQPVVATLARLLRVSGTRRSALSGVRGGESETPLKCVDVAYRNGQLQAGSLAGAVRP